MSHCEAAGGQLLQPDDYRAVDQLFFKGTKQQQKEAGQRKKVR